MTREAVNRVLTQAVVSSEFRTRLLSGQVSAEELLKNKVFVGLDQQDASAVVMGAKNGEMKELGLFLDGYVVAKYGAAGPNIKRT